MKVERIRSTKTHGITIPHFDLLLVSTITLFSFIQVIDILKVISGVLVTTFLPGYVFGLCVFPRRSQLGEIERWGLALIVSTCIAMVLPFVLSAAGLGVTANSYSISLGTIMLTLLGIVVFRRRAVPIGEAYFPTFIFTGIFRWMILFVFGVATVVTVVVRSNLTNYPAFFVTNTNGTFREYPFNATAGKKLLVDLHLENPTTSSLNGLVVASDQRGAFFSRDVVVPPHSSLTITCSLPSKQIGVSENVTFWFHDKQLKDSRMLRISYRIVNPS